MKALRVLGCLAVVTLPLMGDVGFAAQPSDPPPRSENGQGNGWANGQTQGGPAPVIGVGLPMFGAALLVLWLVRRFRQKV